MKEKTIIKSVLMPVLVLALVMTACAFHLTKSDSSAATAYKKVTLKNNAVKKVSNRYFKRKSGKIYCSNKKKSGYKEITKSGNLPIVTNGKNVIYIDNNKKLKKYNCATKKTSTLKKLGSSDETYYSIPTVYKNKIYLTKENEFECSTYRYTISNKKLKKVVSLRQIKKRRGAYLLMTSPDPSDG